jgi:hypothetical protein
MLRRVIWSLISLLFIAYVGETSGLSLVGPAVAQVGSGSGAVTEAMIGVCSPKIQLVGIASSNNLSIDDRTGGNFSGGTAEINGAIEAFSTISASDFAGCGVSNISIISQTGPTTGA